MNRSVAEYINNMLRELLENRHMYFDKNLTLNSEGRKILNKVIAALLQNNFEHRKLLEKVRREPTIENIVKLTELVSESISTSIQ